MPSRTGKKMSEDRGACKNVLNEKPKQPGGAVACQNLVSQSRARLLHMSLQ